MTKSAHNWTTLPGNFDKLNTFHLFETDNKMGIPTIKKEQFVPDWLVPYRQRIRSSEDIGNGAIHTFLDDYRFEQLWHRPFDTFSAIEKIGAALSPDFSTYVDYPIAMQIWNIYRNRWVGAYWQKRGIKVIPTISWSDEQSFDFCFLGVEKGSYVAISTVGVGIKKETHEPFKAGFIEMLKQLEPELVLCYGESSPFKLEEYTNIKWYPSRWKGIKDALKGSAKNGW